MRPPNGGRGEAYYLREQLGDLHTAEAWRTRAGREVRPEELPRPAKTPRRRGAPAANPDKIKPMDELEDDQVEALFFLLSVLGVGAGVGAGGCCNMPFASRYFPVSCCLQSSCAYVLYAETQVLCSASHGLLWQQLARISE